MDCRTTLDQGIQTREAIDRALLRVNTCIPGVVDAFDPATQLVKVVPAVQMRVVVDGREQFITLPPLVNAPLVFPFASVAGFALTLPVRSGDPCLILFSQRAIDNWLERGGVQPPEEGVGSRHHDLTDALVLMAPSPLPGVLGSWQTDAIELRNRARDARVTVRDDRVEAQLGAATLALTDGLIRADGGPGNPKGNVQGDCVCAYTGRPHVMISDTVRSSL